jgi:hypothetical protein
MGGIGGRAEIRQARGRDKDKISESGRAGVPEDGRGWWIWIFRFSGIDCIVKFAHLLTGSFASFLICCLYPACQFGFIGRFCCYGKCVDEVGGRRGYIHPPFVPFFLEDYHHQ